MDYSMQFEYYNYLLQSMIQEQEMTDCIREALILTEGVECRERLEALTEGFGDKLKEIWAKFSAFIKRIFGKFTENMNKFLDTDKGWLEKYSKIIKSKPFKLDITCRDYKLDRVMAAEVPLFNYSALKPVMSSKATFMNSIISDFKRTDSADDLSGWCKAYFCGGKEEEVKMPSINATQLYDYCHDFKDKILAVLTKDENNISKSATNANSLITSAINNSKRASDAAEEEKNKAATAAGSAAQGTTPTQGAPATGGTTQGAAKPGTESTAVSATPPKGTFLGKDPKTGYNIYQDSAIMSRLLGRILTEEEIKPQGSAPSTGTAPTPTANGSSAETPDSATAVVASEKDLTEQQVQEIISIYTAVSGAVASSKITVADWAYRTYMKILRAHVQMYVGTDNTATAPTK